jgi:hypothetical protein
MDLKGRQVLHVRAGHRAEGSSCLTKAVYGFSKVLGYLQHADHIATAPNCD